MKRPIVKYTMILNEMTNEEWHARKLPLPDSARPRPNLQLPDLCRPMFHEQVVEPAVPGFLLGFPPHGRIPPGGVGQNDVEGGEDKVVVAEINTVVPRLVV